MKQIVLAGGCFWGVEAYFKRIKGIIKTKVGYTDGMITADLPSVQLIDLLFAQPRKMS